jgi:hypothetical protein
MTFVRIRLSEQRARQLLSQKVGADWPLAFGATGSRPIVVAAGTAPAPVAPISPTPRRRLMAEPMDSADEALRPLPVREEQPREVEARVEAPVEPVLSTGPEPVEAAPLAEERPAPGPAALAEPAESDAPTLIVPVRPRMPTPTPKPVAAPQPKSLAAAIALATSLPRKPIPEAEPRRDVPAPDPDIEFPDGDWG